MIKSTFFLNLLLFLLLIFVLLFYRYLKNIQRFNFVLGYIEFIFRLFLFVSFFMLFVIFVRFLNLFRATEILNVKILVLKMFNYDLITLFIVFVLLIFLVKFFIYFFKLNFLKLHYYFMNDWNFEYYDEYCDFIYFLVTWPTHLKFFFKKNNVRVNTVLVYYVLRYGFDFIIVFCFIYDIFFHGYDLIFFTNLLPFFSFYKLLYNMNSYLYYNLEFFFDSAITNVLYPLKKVLELQLFDFSLDYKNQEYLVIRRYIKKIISI